MSPLPPVNYKKRNILSKETETVLIFDDQLRSISARLDGLNKIWHEQQATGVYLDFPERFVVRGDDDHSALGFIVSSDDGYWAFRPATLAEQEANQL